MERLFLALKKTTRQNTALIWIGNCLKIGISEIFPFVQSISHMSYFLPEETLTKWTSDSEKQRNRTPQNLVSKILFPAFSSSLKSQAAEIIQASSPPLRWPSLKGSDPAEQDTEPSSKTCSVCPSVLLRWAMRNNGTHLFQQGNYSPKGSQCTVPELLEDNAEKRGYC